MLTSCFGAVRKLHSQNKNHDVQIFLYYSNFQVLFNPEARDVITYPDKFSRAKMIPSVTQFGKKPVDGWIAITSTAMVSSTLLAPVE